MVDDGSALAVLTGATPAELETARGVLDAGGVLVADPLLVDRGTVTMMVSPGPDAGADQPEPVRVRAPAYLMRTGTLSEYSAVVSTKLAAEMKLPLQPAAVVASSGEEITAAHEDRLNAALETLGADSTVYVERGPQHEADPTLLILAGIAALITLGASAIATGLVAADGRADLSTLAAVGATPGLRRRLTLAQSGVIAGLGTMLGGLAGLGGATVLIIAMNRQAAAEGETGPALPLVMPWQLLLLTMVVVPLIAMLGAGLLTRSRLAVERRLA